MTQLFRSAFASEYSIYPLDQTKLGYNPRVTKQGHTESVTLAVKGEKQYRVFKDLGLIGRVSHPLRQNPGIHPNRMISTSH